MNPFAIHTAVSRRDAVIISRHIAEIWHDAVGDAYCEKMHDHISRFRDGYLIGYLSGKPVASSIAFPLGRIPDFEEINTGNIFDFFQAGSEYYYIHIIQVLEKYRNRGYGIRLLRHQIDTARKYRCREVIGMSVDRELPLWKRCGFKDFGEYGTYRHYGRMKWARQVLSPK